MTRYLRHIAAQKSSLSAIGGLVANALTRTFTGQAPSSDRVELGLTRRESVQLPDRRLQQDFIRFCGGDPARYRAHTPPHLFSQWALPVALRFAQRLPYPPLSVVNLGCSLRIIEQLPPTGVAEVHCTLKALEEDSRRVKLTLGLLTLIRNAPALSADLRILVKVPGPKQGASGTKRSIPLIPGDARELRRVPLGRNAGAEFARLTGDFNPIHWIPQYARMVGFRGPILHGFASFALAFESLVAARLCGRVTDLSRFDASFDAPLVLPHDIGVFWSNEQVQIGDAVGGPSYMTAAVALT